MSRGSYGIRRMADRDLDEIAEHLGSRHPDVGLRFLQAVKQECLLLAEYPGAGTLRQRVPKRLRGLRSWPIRGYRNYLIFYLQTEGGIDALRVLHGARRLGRVLRESVE